MYNNTSSSEPLLFNERILGVVLCRSNSFRGTTCSKTDPPFTRNGTIVSNPATDSSHGLELCIPWGEGTTMRYCIDSCASMTSGVPWILKNAANCLVRLMAQHTFFSSWLSHLKKKSDAYRLKGVGMWLRMSCTIV